MEHMFDFLDQIKIRNKILSQHFSEHLATVRLLSMYRYLADDCVIATATTTTTEILADTATSNSSTASSSLNVSTEAGTIQLLRQPLRSSISSPTQHIFRTVSLQLLSDCIYIFPNT